jgi:hypothetical protein
MIDKFEANELLNPEGEVVVQLANGCSLRSGATEFVSGEYVRLVGTDGVTDLGYWDSDEWHHDPILVMGAIINSAAGLRITVEGLDHD